VARANVVTAACFLVLVQGFHQHQVVRWPTLRTLHELLADQPPLPSQYLVAAVVVAVAAVVVGFAVALVAPAVQLDAPLFDAALFAKSGCNARHVAGNFPQQHGHQKAMHHAPSRYTSR